MRLLKKKKIQDKKPTCKQKIELALKEIENLTEEAKTFFEEDEKKKNANK